MIKSPAAFPFPGSYALLEQDRETHLVRIIERDLGGIATIAFPLRVGASGNSRVPVASLLDGTPLDDGETAELESLEARLAGQSRPKKTDLAREEALRLRTIRSRQLAGLIEKGMRSRHIPRDAGTLALATAA